MENAKAIAGILAILSITVFLLVLFALKQPQEKPHTSQTEKLSPSPVYPKNDSTSLKKDAEASDENADNLVPSPPDPRLLEEVRNWGKTPIVFYGKVVDEKNIAIPNAKVDLRVNDLSKEGTTKYQKESDSSGTFVVQGLRGKHLHIDVKKEGYYQGKESFRSFQYAGPGDHFVPNKDKPEIFRLRKKGQQAPLIITGGGIQLPKDGTPVEISLLNGRQAKQGQGDLIVRAWSETDKKTPNGEFPWRFVLEVPQGGLQANTEEFAFKAPESGYIPKLEQQFIPSTPGWRSHLEGESFLKNQDGNYALVHWEMIPGGSHFIYLRSRLNPTGSRVLESDEKSWYDAVSKGQGVFELVLRHKPEPENTP